MSKTVKLTIDDKEITVPEGTRLLYAALDNGIYIPHLCSYSREEHPDASCRLCFVQLDDEPEPATACTVVVREGMRVKTRTPRVDRLVAAAFELLLSDHRLGCARCPANKSCELQKIARERKLKLKLTRLSALDREQSVDDSPATFVFDPGRCVLCGRCVKADREPAGAGAIGFTGRGLKRAVTTYKNLPLAESPCNECGACVEACPVGALFFKK